MASFPDWTSLKVICLEILLGSSFMFGRALTSLLWGMIADRIGRKPVVIMGTISVLVLSNSTDPSLSLHTNLWTDFFPFFCFSVVFNTLFGLSSNFWMAIGTRFLLGSLNGLLGPMRVMLAYSLGISKMETSQSNWDWYSFYTLPKADLLCVVSYILLEWASSDSKL